METPFIATSTGSPTPLPGSGAKTGTPARSPTICSWFTALGRWRSEATSSGVCPSDFIHFASLPASVVLPAPWRPASMITVGGFFAPVQLAGGAAEHLDQLVVDDLDDLLGGIESLGDLFAQGALTHAAGEGAHHRDGDIGVEQGSTDLADRLVDVRFGQAALTAQTLERRCDAIGEVVEHEALPLGRSDRLSVVAACAASTPRSRHRGEGHAPGAPRARARHATGTLRARAGSCARCAPGMLLASGGRAPGPDPSSRSPTIGSGPSMPDHRVRSRRHP